MLIKGPVFKFVTLLMRFLSLAQDIKSMTMLCPDHLEDAGRLGKLESLYPDY